MLRLGLDGIRLLHLSRSMLVQVDCHWCHWCLQVSLGSGQVAWFALPYDTVPFDGRLSASVGLSKGSGSGCNFSVSGCRSGTAAIFGRRFPRKPHGRFVTRTGRRFCCDVQLGRSMGVRKFGEEWTSYIHSSFLLRFGVASIISYNIVLWNIDDICGTVVYFKHYSCF